ncbi:MAG: hypothetical protein AUG44_10525 [Actinobacteria bacterium 13_1_20CM_3_71_11]|nr:MAG: hypothetical protein AUG44_10525 [Actinobacteria bacterium 13_1_20CM_3_71_11]
MSSMPTRRWPPADRLARSTGMVARPMPVAENVAPSGRSRRHATSASGVPGMPPGTPMTRSTCTWPPAGGPCLSRSRRSVVSWPRSKISYSGTMPRSRIRVCSSTMNSQRLRKTSSPKLTVPMVQDAMSGSASRTRNRSASGSVTAPPVESWTIRSVCSRSAATVSRSRPRSSVGRAASSRMWTWITLAPIAAHSRAVVTSSSRVTGRAGTSAFADSAPVGATVINVVVAMAGSSHGDVFAAQRAGRWRAAAGLTSAARREDVA